MAKKAKRTRQPAHPGEVLFKNYMTPSGLSANRLGEILQVPANRISDLVRGRRGITADTALRLAKHFRTNPEYWMDLQRDFEVNVARSKIGSELKQIRAGRR